MDFLEAVNEVLSLNNLQTVNAIATDADLDSSQAGVRVRRARKTVLGKGWDFNTRELPFALGTNSRVALPRDFLHIDLPDGLVPSLDTSDGNVYVWNTRDEKYHATALKDIIVFLDIADDAHFNTLPEALALLIAYTAAVTFWARRNANTPNPRLDGLAREQSMRANDLEHPRTINKTSGWETRRASYSRLARR